MSRCDDVVEISMEVELLLQSKAKKTLAAEIEASRQDGFPPKTALLGYVGIDTEPTHKFFRDLGFAAS